jgi:hypothetical protein
MKKLILFVLAFAIFSIGATQAHATTGGPTYVYYLKYNPADASLYYTEQSDSGRGCPPELKKISVVTGQASTVISCDDAESIDVPNGVETEIAGITDSFSDAAAINLEKNNIDIILTFAGEEKITDDYVLKNHFIAHVYQDGVSVGEFPVEGCSINQPFLFAGYALRGLNKKLVLLLSTKGDCMEGGYIRESLRVISATVKDRTPIAGSYKTRDPLVPSEDTLIVYSEESHRPSSTDPSPTPTPFPTPTTAPVTPVTSTDDTSEITIAIVAALFLIIGVILGHHAKK